MTLLPVWTREASSFFARLWDTESYAAINAPSYAFDTRLQMEGVRTM